MKYFDENIKSSGFKTFDDIELWEKCYWYLRFFIDTNRFGALAKDKKRIVSINENILSTYRLLQSKEYSEEERLSILQNILNDTLFDGIKEGSRKEISVSLLFIQFKAITAVDL